LGNGFLCCSMSVGCIATYSFAGALTLASFSLFLSSAPIFKSSVFFLGLLVLPMSLAAQNLFSTSGLLLGGVSVLLLVMCSSEYFAATPCFIGGVLCPSSNRIRVGCLLPPSVVQLPFWVLRRPAMWDSWRSWMRRIPRCLSIVCRLVQRFNSMLILTCYSRRRQKNLFFAREVVGIKLGAQAAGGENDRECSRTGMYFLFLLRVSLHFGL